MPKCPVCEIGNNTLLCQNCGFDGSQDYERYPSFGKVAGRIESVSAQRRALAKEILHCPQCSRVNLSLNMKKQQCTCTTCGHRFPIPQQKRPKPAPKIFPKVLLAITACLALLLIMVLDPKTPDQQGTAMTDWRDNVLMTQPFKPETFYDYSDGFRTSNIQSVTFLDSFAGAATYYTWDVSANKDKSVLAWAVRDGKYYNVYVAGNGGINAEKACPYLFSNCPSLKTINFGTAFHTEYATSMRSMFDGCQKLTSLDVSHLDTSNVSNMTMTFYNCDNLSIYGIDKWDVSKVSSYGLFMPEGHTINGRPWKEFFN